MDEARSSGEKRGRRLLMLAPSPDITGPGCGPVGMLADSLVRGLRSLGYHVDTELWGRHRQDEGPIRKVAGRAVDLVRIRRRIRRDSYDLVFVNSTHDWRALERDLLLVLPAARASRFVVLFHGSRSDLLVLPGHRLFKAATRSLAHRAAAVLLLSSEEVAQWRQFDPQGAFFQVTNAFGCDDAAETATPRSAGSSDSSDVPQVVYVGRLEREKGLYELLDAFASIRSDRPCHLTIAGHGPEAEGLRAYASELGVSADVEFTGYLYEQDIGRVYERADVFVLPTYREGMPTVLFEAMSHGLPIVTTPVRGAADHMVDGENVLFVPPKAPVPLAEAIVRLLDDDGLRARLGDNNLERVKDFAPREVAAIYDRVFEEVLETSRASR
jgi:glycosyltransferase involved in cell wall biosynthesis